MKLVLWLQNRVQDEGKSPACDHHHCSAILPYFNVKRNKMKTHLTSNKDTSVNLEIYSSAGHGNDANR